MMHIGSAGAHQAGTRAAARTYIIRSAAVSHGVVGDRIKAREREISDLDSRFRVQQHVARLQVAVNHAFVVHIGHARRNLDQQPVQISGPTSQNCRIGRLV